ncbi:protein of unknown function DUF4149 [Trinorchestia longiramus]|nr:protein of unknown function DUF4149 [Trinorchestia longiramus]
MCIEIVCEGEGRADTGGEEQEGACCPTEILALLKFQADYWSHNRKSFYIKTDPHKTRIQDSSHGTVLLLRIPQYLLRGSHSQPLPRNHLDHDNTASPRNLTTVRGTTWTPTSLDYRVTSLPSKGPCAGTAAPERKVKMERREGSGGTFEGGLTFLKDVKKSNSFGGYGLLPGLSQQEELSLEEVKRLFGGSHKEPSRSTKERIKLLASKYKNVECVGSGAAPWHEELAQQINVTPLIMVALTVLIAVRLCPVPWHVSERYTAHAHASYTVLVSAAFGTECWMTFFSGLALFFSVPRHVFAQVQMVLFPLYFLVKAGLLLLALLCLLLARPFQPGNTGALVQVRGVGRDPRAELTGDASLPDEPAGAPVPRPSPHTPHCYQDGDREGGRSGWGGGEHSPRTPQALPPLHEAAPRLQTRPLGCCCGKPDQSHVYRPPRLIPGSTALTSLPDRQHLLANSQQDRQSLPESSQSLLPDRQHLLVNR